MKRVLIVDDTAAFRKFLVRALEMLGYEARGVPTLGEVMTELDGFDPDVVVLDWHLHGASARDLLSQLRESGTAVVVITGDPGAVGDVDVPVLGKPVHLETLRVQLEDSCGRP